MTWNQNAPGLPLIPAAERSDVPVGVGLDIEPHGEGRQAAWVKDYDLKNYPGKVCADGVQSLIDTINVKANAKACQAAFTAPWNITITPLDTCGLVTLTGDKYRRVRDSQDHIAADILANYRLWAAADPKSPANLADERSSTLFDTVATYLAIRQDLCVMEKLGICVTDDGLTVIEPRAKLMNVAMSWKHLGGFEDWVVERLTGKR